MTKNRRATIILIGLAAAAALRFGPPAAGSRPFLSEAGPRPGDYGVGTWDAATLGNHRAVIRVEAKADAVLARIPWRRRDLNPQDKAVFVYDATTGNRILNVYRSDIGRESGVIVFQPQTVPGDYYVYYLPYKTEGRNYPKVTYIAPEATADPGWLAANRLNPEAGTEDRAGRLPAARLVQFQSIDAFDSFYPMEVIATRAETDALLARHPNADYLTFPESREFPIRMTRDLPYRWIEAGARGEVRGRADRGEYFSFQVGVWAARKEIGDLAARFAGLRRKGGTEEIPASAFTCFNLEGVDWKGNDFRRTCAVPLGKVQALWMGVAVPADAVPGTYAGEVVIAPQGMAETGIPVELGVTDQVRADAGDDEPPRLSRLRWLNSRIALDDGIVKPYTPLTVADRTIGCLGREVRLSAAGLPESIRSYFAPEATELRAKATEVLTAPMAFIVETAQGRALRFKGDGVRITKRAEGAVAWEADSRSGDWTLSLKARMEFDGFVDVRADLIPGAAGEVRDIRLEIPVSPAVAKYMMGMGVKGGFRPARFEWRWDETKNQDSLWVGDVNAGLQCAFRDENYVRPLNTNFYLLKPLRLPPSWWNEGKGGFRFSPSRDGRTLLMTATSGPRAVRTGEPLHFYFSLLLTPFKPVDARAQWMTRYYHAFKPLDEIQATGANTVNVHHATAINPYINYPFWRPAEMKAYIDDAHLRGMKVKIYDTVRELSNRAAELFALTSLGEEVLIGGPGGGFSWLQEHLEPDYIAGWFVPELQDAALITSGTSRWHNYYVEGLDWLVRNVGIDGLYIDDVAFDRTVMKRVRKVLERGRPGGALIDLHSANQYNPRDGFANSANLYLEHFPYLDRLWFGEYFDYDSPPDYWLVEISGIPFGLMGEMLEKGGNRWRGMLYGMTARLPWAGDPRPLWKFWDAFGIQDTRMIGYWSPDCPVRTGRPDILATAYVKKGATLVAVASWAKAPARFPLIIDWKALGLDPKRTRMEAPGISEFQKEKSLPPGDFTVVVEPGLGRLFVLSEK
jgi:hypothetical protein